MEKRLFTTADGASIEDEAIQVEPSTVSVEEPIIWDYEDDALPLKRVVLQPSQVRLWKAANATDEQGNPLMSFEPNFSAEPRDS